MPVLNQSAFGNEMNQKRILICNRYYWSCYLHSCIGRQDYLEIITNSGTIEFLWGAVVVSVRC